MMKSILALSVLLMGSSSASELKLKTDDGQVTFGLNEDASIRRTAASELTTDTLKVAALISTKSVHAYSFRLFSGTTNVETDETFPITVTFAGTEVNNQLSGPKLAWGSTSSVTATPDVTTVFEAKCDLDVESLTGTVVFQLQNGGVAFGTPGRATSVATSRNMAAFGAFSCASSCEVTCLVTSSDAADASGAQIGNGYLKLQQV